MSLDHIDNTIDVRYKEGGGELMKQNPFVMKCNDLYFHNHYFCGRDYDTYQQELLDFGVTHPDVNVRKYIARRWCTPHVVRVALLSDKDESVLQALLECEEASGSILKSLFCIPKFVTTKRCYTFLQHPNTPIDIIHELCNHECDGVSEVAAIRLEEEEYFNSLTVDD